MSKYTANTQPNTQCIHNGVHVAAGGPDLGRHFLIVRRCRGERSWACSAKSPMPPVAGWSADVERWESDEDSEDSEGECEADERAGTLSEARILQLML